MSAHKILDQDRISDLWDAIKDYVDEHGGGSGGVFVGSDVPIGTIVFWSGSADEVPTDWHICDGTDGTVDLRDKFILAAGTNHAVGSTGGAEEVTLTAAQMPNHAHIIMTGTQGSGTNLSFKYFSKDVFVTSSTAMALTPDPNKTGRSSYMDSTGGGQAHNNMPPYYALCAIQKISSGSSLDGDFMDVVNNAIDAKLGDIGSILDFINGEVV